MTASALIAARGGSLGGWEILLILTVLLILLWARWLPELAASLRAGHGAGAVAIRAWREFLVLFAEGFGVGRIPFGPGTFGSVAGVFWFFLLARTGSLTSFFLGTALGLAASVFVCGAAERITGRKDPGSVVLDEIVAVPVCFIPWLLSEHHRLHAMPPAEHFFGPRTWWLTLVLFGLFRLFDIWKPWPIRPSQNLPGGWGVTIDDLLAALAVAGLSLLAVS